jgi:translation elongation factor EF-Ts
MSDLSRALAEARYWEAERESASRELADRIQENAALREQVSVLREELATAQRWLKSAEHTVALLRSESADERDACRQARLRYAEVVPSSMTHDDARGFLRKRSDAPSTETERRSTRERVAVQLEHRVASNEAAVVDEVAARCVD